MHLLIRNFGHGDLELFRNNDCKSLAIGTIPTLAVFYANFSTPKGVYEQKNTKM